MMSSESEIAIITFAEEYAKAFAKLNYAWIEQSYSIEIHDREILDAPLESIMRPGGQIFFAVAGGIAIGTVALVNTSPVSFELVKMAVAPSARGRGIGGRLLEAAVDYAASAKRSEIILESNTKQAAAIRLYRKFGFKEIPLDPDSAYSRANIRMRLAIPSVSM